jgi:hypothetical protein
VHVYSIQTFGFLTPGRMSHLASNQHDDLAGERWRLEHAQQMAGQAFPRFWAGRKECPSRLLLLSNRQQQQGPAIAGTARQEKFINPRFKEFQDLVIPWDRTPMPGSIAVKIERVQASPV